MPSQATDENTNGGPQTPSFRLWVDEPKGRVLRDCKCQLVMWGASARRGVLDQLVFRTSSGMVDVRIVDRPDVKPSYPEMDVTGFLGSLSLADHITAVKNGKLRIWVLSGTKIVARFHLKVAAGVFGRAVEQAIGC